MQWHGVAVCLLIILSVPNARTICDGARLASEAQEEPALPDLPHLTLESLAPTVRAQIEKAYELVLAHPHAASANGKLGMFLHAYGFLPEAEICYTRAKLLDPSAFRWVYFLGVVETQEAKCSDAIGTLRAALGLKRGYYPAELELGQCLVVSHQWEDAKRLYESVLHSHPDNAEAYYGLGRVQEAGKDMTAALASFRKACEIYPQFGSAHFALARLYLHTGKHDLAKEEQGLAEKNRGGFPPTEDPVLEGVESLYMDPKSYLKLGAELGGQGHWQDAAQAYEEALKIDPQLTEAHVRLIYLYTQLKEASKAEEHFRASVKLNPKSADAYFNYGVLLLGQGKNSEAEDAFRNTLRIAPKYAQARNNLGYLLEGEGKPAEASEEFRKALEINPNFSQAHFSLGRVLVKEGKFDEGIPHLLKAVESADEATKPSYLYAIGIAFADLGDLENGLRYLRLASATAAMEKQSELQKRIEDDRRLLEGEATTP
jgi:Tfp pilus assembly protein PilF